MPRGVNCTHCDTNRFTASLVTAIDVRRVCDLIELLVHGWPWLIGTVNFLAVIVVSRQYRHLDIVVLVLIGEWRSIVSTDH